MPQEDGYKTDYQAIAKSQNAVVLTGKNGVGAAGDIVARLLVIPDSTSPGAVTIQDGNDAAITVFPGGVNSVADLKAIPVELGARSLGGAWKVTTGDHVSVIAIGRFQ